MNPIIILLSTFILLSSTISYAQFGGLKNTLKKKYNQVTQKDSKKDATPKNNDSTQSTEKKTSSKTVKYIKKDTLTPELINVKFISIKSEEILGETVPTEWIVKTSSNETLKIKLTSSTDYWIWEAIAPFGNYEIRLTSISDYGYWSIKNEKGESVKLRTNDYERKEEGKWWYIDFNTTTYSYTYGKYKLNKKEILNINDASTNYPDWKVIDNVPSNVDIKVKIAMIFRPIIDYVIIHTSNKDWNMEPEEG